MLFNPDKIMYYKNKCYIEPFIHTIKIFNQLSQLDDYMFGDDTENNESENMD